MKHVFFLMCFLLSVTTFSCKSSQAPGDVAVTFLKSIEEGDIETARKFSSDNTKSILSMLDNPMFKKEFQKSIKDSEKSTYEVLDTKIDGDKAVCKIKATKTNGNTQESDLPLVKEGGKWLVDMDKEGMNKEGN